MQKRTADRPLAAKLKPEELESLLTRPSLSAEELAAAAAHHALTEDSALSLLERRDLDQGAIESLARNGRVMKGRKVKIGVASHPRTPRHISLPLIRHLFTFELMKLALAPAVAADVKMAAEDALINRLSTITAGERISLARQSSGRVAAELLQDDDQRIVHAALHNSRLTEPLLVKALGREETSQHLARAVSRDEKWKLRLEVRTALLLNPFTPLAQAIVLAEVIPLAQLKELMERSKLPQAIKSYLLETAEKRLERG